MHLTIGLFDWMYELLYIEPSDTILVIALWVLFGLLAVLVLIVLIVIAKLVAMIFHEYIEEGEIVKKVYEPERWWTQYIPIMVGNINVLIPFMHFDDEDWVLVVRGQNSKGKKQTDRFYVSKQKYDSVKVGDWYVVGNNDETSDPHKKTRSESEG